MKIFLTIFFSLFAAVYCVAQEPDCDALFKKVTDKVRSMRLTSANGGFEMSARISIISEDDNVVREKMDIKSGMNKYKYTTNAMTMYQDEKSLVVIQKEERSIFITKPAAEKLRQNQFLEMMKLQDSLQKFLVLRSCVKEFGAVEKNVGYIKIVFEPGQKLKDTGLSSLVYWVDTQLNEVKKIMIHYTKGSGYGLKSYELIIDRMDVRYDKIPFEGEAIAAVMQGGTLRKEYSGYQVNDSRK